MGRWDNAVAERKAPLVSESLSDPVINGPYDPPARHFELGLHGPTGVIIESRRRSESFIPIPPPKKRGRGKTVLAQPVLQDDLLSLTNEHVRENDLINYLRRAVTEWRRVGFTGVTPTTLKLIRHWEDTARENRVLFCQREAAETAIFLAEVAGREASTDDWRKRLDEVNDVYNAGMPRLGLKMATGSGKTVVMAMLIAWQTLNRAQHPSDSRFVNRFLVVTPGITIKDRLRVLQPSDPGNYYDARDLVPADLRTSLSAAQIIVTNYHAFMPRDAKEIRGVSRTTRSILLRPRRDENAPDPFKETEAAVVSRVLRGWRTTGRTPQIVVFNDEAHHCYAYKPPDDPTYEGEAADAEAKDANAQAGVWFSGLQAVLRHVGVKQVYDLSATPFYLNGSGYASGFIFPWTVSDFSLMDAIESGIVKVPRTPVDDDATNDLVTYLNLWESVGTILPKRGLASIDQDTWQPPPELEGALTSLYRSYETSFRQWEEHLKPLDEPPPVMIVVCSNTTVSKLVHSWIAGRVRANGTHADGHLPLLANVTNGHTLDRPQTILVDSAQLESGDAIKGDFKTVAAEEIEQFKEDLRRRNPGMDVDKVTDEDLLREVMNTVGKKGTLGEPVRCVVSVSMLTEGWDANTVTHILGIRAFRSQLLCEQVVGRGLRRRSYAVNEQGRFDAEYANVYGVPFAFIPNDKPMPPPKPPKPTVEVHSMPDRARLRITFPKVSGYRLEVPDEELWLDPTAAPRYLVGPSSVPTWTDNAPIVGANERIQTDGGPVRESTVAMQLAKRLLDHEYVKQNDKRPWLFPSLFRICRQWLATCVDYEPGFHAGSIVQYAEFETKAAEAVYQAITSRTGDRRPRMRVLFHPDKYGDTGSVKFTTARHTRPTTRSEVNRVVLDGPGGNTWEEHIAQLCDDGALPVASYVKNDHLGFVIPYVHKGRSHEYIPDFLLRLKRRDTDTVDRTLIVEVSGGMKSAHSPGSVKDKAQTARQSWCAGVNNHGGFGRWGYLEITDKTTARDVLLEACRDLYADAPIVGDPDLLDERVTSGT